MPGLGRLGSPCETLEEIDLMPESAPAAASDLDDYYGNGGPGLAKLRPTLQLGFRILSGKRETLKH